jgi:hypothetical protein
MMFTPGETKSGGIAGLFAPKSKNGRGRELVFGGPIEELEDFPSLLPTTALNGLAAAIPPDGKTVPDGRANYAGTHPVIGAKRAGLESRLARP